MNDLKVYLSPVNERARRIAASRLGLVLDEYDELRRARKKCCSGPTHRTPVWLPESDFSVHKGRGDGLQSWCRDCMRFTATQRRRESR